MDHLDYVAISCGHNSGRFAGVALGGPTADATTTAWWWCRILARNPFTVRQLPEDPEELLLFPLSVLTSLLPLSSVFPHALKGLPDSLFSVRFTKKSTRTSCNNNQGVKIHQFESPVWITSLNHIRGSKIVGRELWTTLLQEVVFSSYTVPAGSLRPIIEKEEILHNLSTASCSRLRVMIILKLCNGNIFRHYEYWAQRGAWMFLAFRQSCASLSVIFLPHRPDCSHKSERS